MTARIGVESYENLSLVENLAEIRTHAGEPDPHLRFGTFIARAIVLQLRYFVVSLETPNRSTCGRARPANFQPGEDDARP